MTDIYKVSATIVTYNSDFEDLLKAIESFNKASLKKSLLLIDNNSGLEYFNALKAGVDEQIIRLDNNRGYGSGHNVGVVNSVDSEYHLVLNPDVVIHEGTLEALVDFMDSNSSVGLVSPKVLNTDSSLQCLNKRQPTVLDLFLRRFVPSSLHTISIVKKRLDYYEMKDKGYDVELDIPYMTGCFMLFRRSVFEKILGFDENIFLHFEDADITRRVNEVSRAVYYPNATITHGWVRGSHTSFAIAWITIKSAFYYFNKWGWKWM